jgi:uncharacterized GH25 family protein
VPRVPALGLLAALLVAAPARAHDSWLEPTPLAPERDGPLALRLWTEELTGEAEEPMEQARLVSLRQFTAWGELDLLPQVHDGERPFLAVRLGGAGGYLFGVEREPSRVELAPLKYNRYLRHQGLHAALEARKQAGERWRPGRERVNRYLKSFVQVGEAADGVSTRVLGHRLELVPDRDLAELRPGQPVGLELRFEGQPLAGARIEAVVRAHDGRVTAHELQTDALGRVGLTLDQPGLWLLRAVHIRRCDGCDDADWESFRTAYSFALR